MPNHDYTNGVPNPPNLPSTDVGAMQVNTNSISAWVLNDHHGFNAGNPGGYHKQVTMQDQGAPGIPVGMDGVLYCDDNGGNSWPIWQNALGSFQLTGSASANNPSAGGNNGWTFLPGGFIFQWGVVLAPTYVTGVLTPILFVTANIDFPANCFNVQATLIPSPGPIPGVPTAAGGISIGPISNTGFSFKGFNGNYIGFYWTAIGN